MYLSKFENIQKIDLSFNIIKKLPDASCFEKMYNLKFLYLHDNLISSWSDLYSLKGANSLLHVTLQRNPVC